MADQPAVEAEEISLKQLFGHQYKAIELLERFDCVLQFGSRGSGKSETIDQFIIQESLRYPGNSGIVVRRKQEDASVDDYDHFLKACPPQLIHSKGNEGQSRYVKIIPYNWDRDETKLSKVLFIGCISEGKQNPDAVKGEFGWAVFPELSEIIENVFQQADTSVRMPGTGRKILCASNRVPRQHWIFQHFGLESPIESEDFYINPDTGYLADDGELRQVYSGPYPMKVALTSKTTDNHGLDPDYVQKKFANMPSAWLAKYINGESGFEPDGRGMFEKDFRADIHVAAVATQPTYIIRSFDADLNPAVLWGQFVRGAQGVWEHHLLAECTGYDVMYSEFIANALELELEIFGNGYQFINCGDPALRARDKQTKLPSLGILADFGIKDVRFADDIVRNSRHHRILICQSWLKVDGECSRTVIHPRCEVLIEGCEGGYKKKFNASVGKLVQEPIKDPFYAAVQDCWQYQLTNFADMRGNVTIYAGPPRGSSIQSEQPRSTEARMPLRKRPASRIVRG